MLHVEDYRHDRVLDDIDLLATGYKQSEGEFWEGIDRVDTVREDDMTLHRIPRSELPEAYPTSSCMTTTALSPLSITLTRFRLLAVDSRDNLMNQRFWGLAPRI